MNSPYLKQFKIAVPVAAILFGASCNSIKKSANNFEKVTMEAEPKVLELKGDSVPYKVTLTAQPNDISSKVAVKIDPVLLYGDEALPRPPVIVKGEKSKVKADKEINSKEGGTYEWSDNFKYEPAMATSKLIAKPTVIMKGDDPVLDQCIETKERVLAEGIITTPLLLKAEGEDILYSVDPYIAAKGGVDLNVYYLINSTNFNSSYKVAGGDKMNNKENLKAMSDLLKNPEMRVQGIEISSYASPDGPLDNNQKLAPGRTKSTFEYLRKELKKQGFEEANDSNFYVRSSLAEDWQGWMSAVAASDLADKDNILEIMGNTSMSDEQKEVEIKSRFPASYNKMRNVMLPSLRRSVVTFRNQAPLKTDEELLESRNDLNALSAAECLQLGKIAPDDNLRKTVYQHMTTKYPEDWRGFNNLAVVQARNAKGDTNAIKEAGANFQKAADLNEGNNIVKNNRAIIARRTGDYKLAESLLKEVEASDDSTISDENIAHNLGTLYLRTGEYDKALPYLDKDKCRFNSALGYTVAGKLDEAKKSIDCMPNEDKDASAYYLAAIIGSRSSKLEDVTTNLTRSIQLDAAMRDKAKGDPEFMKYRSTSEFQSAIR